MPDKRVYYGGQAVLEGVMIRGPRTMAVACRRPDGEITVHTERLGGVYSGPIRRFPLLRGAIVMWETLALGIRALIFSSNVALGEEEKGVDSGAMKATAAVSLVLVAALFFVLPLIATDWLDNAVGSHLGKVPLDDSLVGVLVAVRTRTKRPVGHAAHVELAITEEEELPHRSRPNRTR